MSLLNQASLIQIPSGYKDGTLYSAKPINGDGDLDFTRSNDTATRVNSAGLIEKVRTNLALYSEQFTNAYWSKTATSITANSTTSPDGTITADTITADGTSSRHDAFLSLSATSGTAYSYSVYVKKNTNDFFQIATGGGFGSNAFANFDLVNGVLGSIGSSATATITNAGGGWYRCTITATATTTGTTGIYNLISTSSTASRLEVNTLTTSIFIWGAQLELSDFGATDYIPTTTTAVSVGMLANVPRVDYSGGGCGKLLLEPQRTNDLTFSEQFDNAGWSKLNATITANDIVSPDGYQNADRITDNAFSTSHAVYRTGWDTTQRTASVYAKAGTSSKVYIINGATGTGVFADLSTGTFIANGTFTGTLTEVGNGWYRITATHTAASAQTFAIGLFSGTSSTVYVGTGSYAYIWGAQLEAGTYVTSYINTLSAVSTRGIDVMVVDDVYTNNLVTASGGTWYIEIDNNFVYTRDGANVGIYIANDTSGGTSTDGLALRNNGATARLTINKRVATIQTQLYVTTTDHVKVALKWNGTTLDVFQNGVKVVNATAFTPTIMEYFGSFGGDVPKYIIESLLFPTPLTDVECIELTTL